MPTKFVGDPQVGHTSGLGEWIAKREFGGATFSGSPAFQPSPPVVQPSPPADLYYQAAAES